MKTIFSLAVLTLTMLPAVLTGCNKPVQSSEGATKAKAELATVERRDLADVVDIAAEIEGDKMTSLVSRVEAYVKDVMVDIGEEVSEKTLLAKLKAPEIEAEVTRRKQLLDKARSDQIIRDKEVEQAQARQLEQEKLKELRQSQLKRITRLVEKGSYNKEKQEEAEFALAAVEAAIARGIADVAAAEANVIGAAAEVKVAEAEKDKAIAVAGYLNIVAPFDGLITERLVDPGAFVRPATNGGAPLLKIESVKNVRVVVYLPTEDAVKLDSGEKGDKATLYGIDGLPGEEFSGTISRFAKSFQRGSRMMRAEIDLPNPKDPTTGKRKLKPGDFGKVKLTLAEYPDIAVVPADAVGKDSRGEDYVLVVDRNNICRRYPVEVKVEISEDKEQLKGIVGRDDVEIPRGARVIAKELKNFKDGYELSPDELPASK